MKKTNVFFCKNYLVIINGIDVQHESLSQSSYSSKVAAEITSVSPSICGGKLMFILAMPFLSDFDNGSTVDVKVFTFPLNM